MGRRSFQELEAPWRWPSRKVKIMMGAWEVAFSRSENNDEHLVACERSPGCYLYINEK